MRRLIVAAVAVGLLMALGAGCATSQPFPTKNINIIVPFAAGGGADVMLREIAAIMSADLKVGMGLVNTPGAGGAVGWQQLAAADPDGHTIGYTSSSLVFLTLLGQGSVDFKNYEPIGMMNARSYSVTVKAGAPWKTLAEFNDYAKKNPDKVRVANGGAGSIWHIAALLYEKAVGAKFTHVPYGGGAEARAALAGGHVEATFVSPAELGTLVEAGQLRMLAVGSEAREPKYKDVPTVKELGITAPLELWAGVIAPKAIAKDRLARLEKSFKDAANSDRYKQHGAKNGYDLAFLDAKGFAQKMTGDAERLKPIMESLKAAQAKK